MSTRRGMISALRSLWLGSCNTLGVRRLDSRLDRLQLEGAHCTIIQRRKDYCMIPHGRYGYPSTATFGTAWKPTYFSSCTPATAFCTILTHSQLNGRTIYIDLSSAARYLAKTLDMLLMLSSNLLHLIVIAPASLANALLRASQSSSSSIHHDILVSKKTPDLLQCHPFRFG